MATTAAPMIEAALQDRLQTHVQMLAGAIGIRNRDAYANLEAAARYIDSCLSESEYTVHRQEIHAPDEGVVWNLEARLPGSDPEAGAIVVGAHYDSAPACPGANDNGSGVAALLELARFHTGQKHGRAIRFVAFANEEDPHYKTPLMGSVVYAEACRQRGDRIHAMVCLETIGYYSHEPRTQAYPFPLEFFGPDTANFVALVGNLKSRAIVTEAAAAFRETVDFPMISAAIPTWVPGASASDHWAFWQRDYPAVMITDTANFRYREFHTARDTPDRLAYSDFTQVVAGISGIIAHLANS